MQMRDKRSIARKKIDYSSIKEDYICNLNSWMYICIYLKEDYSSSY